MHKEAVAYQWVYFCQIACQFEGSMDSHLVWLDYVEPASYASAIQLLDGQLLDGLDIDGKTLSIRRKDLNVLVTTPNGGEHFKRI